MQFENLLAPYQQKLAHNMIPNSVVFQRCRDFECLQFLFNPEKYIPTPTG